MNNSIKRQTRFIIIRNDLAQEPITITSETLLLGRLRECNLVLNHPAVSRVHAGIKQIAGEHRFFSLRPSNPAILNGRPVNEDSVLAAGDLLEVGPFLLANERANDEWIITVSLLTGRASATEDVSSRDLTTKALEPLKGAEPVEGIDSTKTLPALRRLRPPTVASTLDLYWDKRITSATKLVRPAPLFPKGERPTGKARSIWKPTSDLAQLSPVAFIICVAIGVLLIYVCWHLK